MTKGYRAAMRAIVCLIAVALVVPAAASAANVQVGSAKWFWGNPLPQGNNLGARRESKVVWRWG